MAHPLIIRTINKFNKFPSHAVSFLTVLCASTKTDGIVKYPMGLSNDITYGVLFTCTKITNYKILNDNYLF